MSMALTRQSQYLLIAHALKKNNIATLLITVLEPDDFSVPDLQIIWKNFQNYWRTYQKLPSYQELIEIMPEHVISTVAELYATSNLEEVPSIVEKALAFKKAQHLKKVVEEANFLVHTNPDRAEQIIRKGLSDLPIMNYTLKPMSDNLVESIYDHDELMTGYPLGIKAFESGLKNGVRPGELFFIAAPAGMGKSTILCSIAGAVAMFTPVLYITLELSVVDITKKITARIAKKRLSQLTKDLPAKEFVKINKRLQSAFPVFVEYYSSGSVSMNQIAGMLDYLKHVKGINIGALFIDYADLLRPSSELYGRADWEKVANIWQAMVDIGHLYNVAIFTASQLGKDKGDIYDTEEIQQKDLSGTKEKINKCDISLAFKPVGPREGNIQKGIWSWLKVRRSTMPEPFFGAIDYDRLKPIYIRPHTSQSNTEVIGEATIKDIKKKKEESKPKLKTISIERGDF